MVARKKKTVRRPAPAAKKDNGMNGWTGGVLMLVGILYLLHDMNLFAMTVDMWHLLVFLFGLNVLLGAIINKKNIELF